MKNYQQTLGAEIRDLLMPLAAMSGGGGGRVSTPFDRFIETGGFFDFTREGSIDVTVFDTAVGAEILAGNLDDFFDDGVLTMLNATGVDDFGLNGLAGRIGVGVVTDFFEVTGAGYRVSVGEYTGDDEIEIGGSNNSVEFGVSFADEHLLSGTGNSLSTGAGNDEIVVETGGNTVNSGAGNDEIEGSDGSDFIDAGDGIDEIDGGAGNDELFGGNSFDFIDGDAGNDQIFGGAGSDDLSGGSGDDLISGGEGHDFVSGGGGNDILAGNAGHDVIDDGFGRDVILPGTGDDFVRLTNDGEVDVIIFNGLGSGSGRDFVSGFEIGIDRAVGYIAGEAVEIDVAGIALVEGGTASFGLDETTFDFI